MIQANPAAITAAHAHSSAPPTTGTTADTDTRKHRVRRALAVGLDGRYGRRIDMLGGCSTDAALCRVQRWLRNERAAFGIAAALGHGSLRRVEVLRELELLLRYARRYGMTPRSSELEAA